MDELDALQRELKKQKLQTEIEKNRYIETIIENGDDLKNIIPIREQKTPVLKKIKTIFNKVKIFFLRILVKTIELFIK